MPRFLVELTTDDARDTELYGEPYTEEGLQVALEAAFSSNAAEVHQVVRIPTGQQVINYEIGQA